MQVPVQVLLLPTPKEINVSLAKEWVARPMEPARLRARVVLLLAKTPMAQLAPCEVAHELRLMETVSGLPVAPLARVLIHKAMFEQVLLGVGRQPMETRLLEERVAFAVSPMWTDPEVMLLEELEELPMGPTPWCNEVLRLESETSTAMPVAPPSG